MGEGGTVPAGANRAPIVVCGAGAAGLAAALAAARSGAQVLLIEATKNLGGTVANALIHTLGGLYDSRGELLNDGLAGELVGRLSRADSSVSKRRLGRAWVLNVCPDLYRTVVGDWVATQPLLTALYDARVSRVESSGGWITGIEINGASGPLRLRPRAVIDCTGTAEVVRLLDAKLVHDDPRRSAAGLIVRLRGVEAGAAGFPRGLAAVRSIHAAAAEGKLPTSCAHAWVDSGTCADQVYLKLSVPLPGERREPEARAEITTSAMTMADATVSFLKGLPGFGDAHVDRIGTLGIRDGGRVRGEYTLNEADVRAGRKFTDAACRCSWPIEYWDPDRGVSLEYLPESSYYEIPLRALRVRGVRNLWAAGKCLSADRLAHASARVVGSCWTMGEAAGRAAAS
jgi:FAD dependent oxidoreductase